MTYQQTRNTILEWLQEIIPARYTIAFAYPASVVPPVPSLVVHVLTRGASVGVDDQTIGSGGVLKFAGARRMTVQFIARGSDALDVVELIRQGLTRPTQAEILQDGSVAFVQELGAIDTTFKHRETWQTRASIDLEFRYVERYEDRPGTIEDASFGGELIEGHDGDNIEINATIIGE